DDAKVLASLAHTTLVRGLAVPVTDQVNAAVAEVRLEALNTVVLGARAFPRPRELDYLEVLALDLHALVEVLDAVAHAVAFVPDLDDLHARLAHPLFAQIAQADPALVEAHLVMESVEHIAH